MRLASPTQSTGFIRQSPLKIYIEWQEGKIHVFDCGKNVRR
jgi:hypothetical protein